jgi:hypothetical protein
MDPWALSWEAVAAVAAASAAAVSLLAVVFAARAAHSAAQAAKVAEDQLAAQTLPVVVEVPLAGRLTTQEKLEFWGGIEIEISRVGEVIYEATGDEAVCVSIPIQNIGTGLAQVRDAVLEVDFRPTSVSLVPTSFGSRVAGSEEDFSVLPHVLYLPPQGQDRLAAEVFPAGDDGERVCDAASGRCDLRVRIDYADAAGTRRYETSLVLAKLEDGTWRVKREATIQKSG